MARLGARSIKSWLLMPTIVKYLLPEVEEIGMESLYQLGV